MKNTERADDGARTRDHEVKSLALYRLSYIGVGVLLFLCLSQETASKNIKIKRPPYQIKQINGSSASSPVSVLQLKGDTCTRAAAAAAAAAAAETAAAPCAAKTQQQHTEQRQTAAATAAAAAVLDNLPLIVSLLPYLSLILCCCTVSNNCLLFVSVSLLLSPFCPLLCSLLSLFTVCCSSSDPPFRLSLLCPSLHTRTRLTSLLNPKP